MFSHKFGKVFQELYAQIFQVAFDYFQNAICNANFIL
jgi:hypothetical protein